MYDLFTLDSTAKDGTTETSALFAGTGSEVTPNKSRKRSGKKSSKKRKTSVSKKRSSTLAKDLTTSPPQSNVVSNVEGGSTSIVPRSDGPSAVMDDEPHVLTAPHEDVVVIKRKKKKHKRRRGVVDGREVEGVEHTCVYEPGSGDEGSNQQQDDFILKKLFKKTGE